MKKEDCKIGDAVIILPDVNDPCFNMFIGSIAMVSHFQDPNQHKYEFDNKNAVWIDIKGHQGPWHNGTWVIEARFIAPVNNRNIAKQYMQG